MYSTNLFYFNNHLKKMKGNKKMTEKEKKILDNLEQKESPMEFELFMQDNQPEDFTEDFKIKFSDLHNQVIFDYNFKYGKE